MRFVGRGHPAIRATHAKTLELSPDRDITARATCIVAVGVEPVPAQPMAGPVRIRIAAGGERFAFDAVANPSWDPAGPAVIRRGLLRIPGTFATCAGATSAELPRELVTALQDPDALVTVDVVDIADEREVVVLFAADAALASAPASLRAEHQRADTVTLQDAGARRLVSARSGAGPRHLVLATAGLPRATGHPHAAIETVGLTPALAAAAASPSTGPLVIADPGADARALLRSTPAGHRLVLCTAAPGLPALLDLARELRGSAACVLTQEFAAPQRLPDGAAPELPSRADVHVCFDARSGDDALDPSVRTAVTGLLDSGVATKAVAGALAALTGWDRRRAYAVVVALRGATSGDGPPAGRTPASGSPPPGP